MSKPKDNGDQVSDGEDDLLWKCKIAIEDLTKQLQKEKQKSKRLENQIAKIEEVKIRNTALQEQRKDLIKENTLLRMFIADMDNQKESRPTLPLSVTLAPMKTSTEVQTDRKVENLQTPLKNQASLIKDNSTGTRTYSSARRYLYPY